MNRRPGQVCVFSPRFASLTGVQFDLRLWIMQPGPLVLPEVRRWGKPWDRVYRYLHSKCRLLSVRDQTRWKRIRMIKTWRLEMSRWPLSVDMFLLQCYLMCNHLVKKHSTRLFNFKGKRTKCLLGWITFCRYFHLWHLCEHSLRKWCLSLSLLLKLWLITEFWVIAMNILLKSVSWVQLLVFNLCQHGKLEN